MFLKEEKKTTSKYLGIIYDSTWSGMFAAACCKHVRCYGLTDILFLPCTKDLGNFITSAYCFCSKIRFYELLLVSLAFALYTTYFRT